MHQISRTFIFTIGDILQIPLILTHAQTKSNYTLKKFWPSKFANDPQIFKQGVINDPQKFWSCRNTETLQKGAYDQSLHCLLAECSIKIWIKNEKYHTTTLKTEMACCNRFVCLIWFFTSQSTIFQLCLGGSSWVEPVLSKDKCVLLKDTTQWHWWGLVRLEPGAPGLEPSTLPLSHCAATSIRFKWVNDILFMFSESKIKKKLLTSPSI